MRLRSWLPTLLLTTGCLLLGLLLVVQLRTESSARQEALGTEWEFLLIDLIDGNNRLRQEIESVEQQLADLDQAGGGGVMESLVAEVNYLRIANGMIEVSGPGVELILTGPISVLDLHDLINELRNAGAEALALNGRRLVAWSAIGTDGQHVTVDGQPIETPYRLQAIGPSESLKTALLRTGGMVDLIGDAKREVSIEVLEAEKLTLPRYDSIFQFAYARAVD